MYRTKEKIWVIFWFFCMAILAGCEKRKEEMMVFDEVVFFIADDYSYEYLKEQGFIEPFSRLGVGEEDEFALSLNGHALLEGTDLEKYGNWYLLVKVKTEINASDEVYVARREALADMIAALKSE